MKYIIAAMAFFWVIGVMAEDEGILSPSEVIELEAEMAELDIWIDEQYQELLSE